MASSCPRCGAARGTGRYCSSCAYDYWGAAAGYDQTPPSTPEPQQPADTTPAWVRARKEKRQGRSRSNPLAALLLAIATFVVIAWVVSQQGNDSGAASATRTSRPTSTERSVATEHPTPAPPGFDTTNAEARTLLDVVLDAQIDWEAGELTDGQPRWIGQVDGPGRTGVLELIGIPTITKATALVPLSDASYEYGSGEIMGALIAAVGATDATSWVQDQLSTHTVDAAWSVATAISGVDLSLRYEPSLGFVTFVLEPAQ